MPFQPESFKPPWQPKKIVGNTAYYYNPETGETKSAFIPNNELYKRRKEFAEWKRVYSKYQYSMPWDGKQKRFYAVKKDYQNLKRDPYAPYDFNQITRREGTVTRVLAGDRIVVDGTVIKVRGIDIPSPKTHYSDWLKAKQFTEDLVLNKNVSLAINLRSEYDQNGDVLADVQFSAPPNTAPSKEDEWGVWDYLNVPGYWFGSQVRNLAIWRTTGEWGTTSTGDKYSLSDTFTFSRLAQQIKGTARPISAYGKGETEGEWYEKIGVDIFGDPSNLVSIEGKGIRLAGKTMISGRYYSKPLLALKSKITTWANGFERPVYHGAEPVIDQINRLYRRVQTLLAPAYYSVNAQLGLWNAMLGGTNPKRFLDIHPILKQADNPALRSNIVVTSIKNRRYTAQEIKALMVEYGLTGQGGVGDIARNPHVQATLSDKVWEPLLRVAKWEEDRIRGAMFIDRLRKGDLPDQAAKHVKHFQFDYDPAHLTAFERAYLNRIIPFYVPQSRNIALQAEQFLKNPYKYTTLAKWQIQERRFAGEEQFKDYDRNTILVKVGDGSYVKLRFPTEDITQLPERFSSARKAALALTYPTINMPLELVEDLNYFDNTRPSSNYEKYLLKKWVGRLYYSYQTAANPNIPVTEKASKLLLSATFVHPDDRKALKQSLIDAGFSPNDAEQEAKRLEQRHKSLTNTTAQAVQKIRAQAALPEAQRDRPIQEDWHWWDFINTVGYFTGAQYRNLAIWRSTGKWGTVKTEDKFSVSDTFSFTRLYGMITGKSKRLGEFEKSEEAGFWERMLVDIPTDASNWISGGVGGLRNVAGKTLQKGLTYEGVQALSKHLNKIPKNSWWGLRKTYDSWGHREAYWKLMAEVRKQPELAAKYFTKDGIRISLTNIQLVPKKYLLMPINAVKLPVVRAAEEISRDLNIAKEKLREITIIQSTLERVKNSFKRPDKLKVRWMDDFQQMLKEHQDRVRLQKKLAEIDIHILKDEANRAMDVWRRAKALQKGHPTKGYFSFISDLSKETGQKINELREAGLVSSPEVNKVLNRLETAYTRMAIEEKARGILTATREHYTEHIYTPAYKSAHNIVDPVLRQLDIYAPFAKKRTHLGTIAEENAKALKRYGYELFEKDAFKILKIRTYQHIEATEVYDFLKAVADKYGIPLTKDNQAYFKVAYGVSKIPTLQHVLLPIELIAKLEHIPVLKAHIATLNPKPFWALGALDKYDWLVSFWKRNVTIMNPPFIGRNLVSSIHQNVMAGMRNVFEYLPGSRNNDVLFETKLGEKIYKWEYDEALIKYKIIGQQSMELAGTKPVSDWGEAISSGPRWLQNTVEFSVRRALFNARLREGDSYEQAGAYVMKYHLDYSKQYGPAMRIAARFITFPIWKTEAPFMVAGAMLERPGTFTTIPKITGAWNSPEDEIALRYRPDYLKGKILMKVPYTDDAYYSPPFATEELSQLPYQTSSQTFHFYWHEAKKNPNIIKKFAKYNLGIDWMLRGGGVAELKGDEIIITYKETGDSITARMTSNNSLIFIDNNTNVVLKEFATVNNGGKIGILTDREPLQQIASRWLLPWVYMAPEVATGRDWFTGKPIEDWGDYLFNKLGGGAVAVTLSKLIDPDTELYEKIIEVTGIGNVYHAKDWEGLETSDKEKIVRVEMRKLRGSYHGCGF